MRADPFEKKERPLRAALEATTQRLEQHFVNQAARATAGSYLQSLLSGVERKNIWQLAEAAGLDTPDRFQHLLGRGAWEADALRDEQLGVVLAGLGVDDAVLAVDETGFIKQGKKSVGVKRQYTGTSGKIDNCRIGVFLSWQTAKGHALIDRVLYLPKEWAEDKERRQAAGGPEAVEFATKPALAREMVARVLPAQTSEHHAQLFVAQGVLRPTPRVRAGAESGRACRKPAASANCHLFLRSTLLSRLCKHAPALARADGLAKCRPRRCVVSSKAARNGRSFFSNGSTLIGLDQSTAAAGLPL